jgi:hypothetical protein
MLPGTSGPAGEDCPEEESMVKKGAPTSIPGIICVFIVNC